LLRSTVSSSSMPVVVVAAVADIVKVVEEEMPASLRRKAPQQDSPALPGGTCSAASWPEEAVAASAGRGRAAPAPSLARQVKDMWEVEVVTTVMSILGVVEEAGTSAAAAAVRRRRPEFVVVVAAAVQAGLAIPFACAMHHSTTVATAPTVSSS
jgi:hypothetical protein